MFKREFEIAWEDDESIERTKNVNAKIRHTKPKRRFDDNIDFNFAIVTWIGGIEDFEGVDEIFGEEDVWKDFGLFWTCCRLNEKENILEKYTRHYI